MKDKKAAAVFCVVLLLSLAGNFFMGGLLLTSGEAQRSLDRLHSFQSAVKLPDADKKIIDDAMAAHKADFDALKEKLNERRNAVFATIRTNTPDSKKVTVALQQEVAAKKEFILYIQKVRAETLPKLSDEARALLQKAPPRQLPGKHPGYKADKDYPPFIWEEINTGS